MTHDEAKALLLAHGIDWDAPSTRLEVAQAVWRLPPLSRLPSLDALSALADAPKAPIPPRTQPLPAKPQGRKSYKH